MDNLSDILNKIKNKPSVYLGKPSINCVQAFLSGYNVAQYQLGLPLQQENPLDGFQDWIQKKFNIDSSQSWANIILFFSQDERDALDIFFQLFEEFCQSKARHAHRELPTPTAKRYGLGFPIHRESPLELRNSVGLTFPPRAGVLVPKTQFIGDNHYYLLCPLDDRGLDCLVFTIAVAFMVSVLQLYQRLFVSAVMVFLS